VLVQEVSVTNLSHETVELDAVPVLEYTHFDALKQFTNADWVPQTMQSEVHDDGAGRKILAQFAFMNKAQRQTYFTASVPVSSFETDRRVFLGDNEYGTFQQPKSLLAAELSSSLALRGDNIAALMLPLGALAPGQSARFVTLLTQQEGTPPESLAAARGLFEKYRDDQAVSVALAAMRGSWDEYLGNVQVSTPDASMNSMLNVHNPRQCYMTKNWSRDLSLYQLGFGGRTGIYELVEVNEAMRVLIHDGSGEHRLEEHARASSPSIRSDGLARVLAGDTSLEEVLRVAREE